MVTDVIIFMGAWSKQTTETGHMLRFWHHWCHIAIMQCHVTYRIQNVHDQPQPIRRRPVLVNAWSDFGSFLSHRFWRHWHRIAIMPSHRPIRNIHDRLQPLRRRPTTRDQILHIWHQWRHITRSLSPEVFLPFSAVSLTVFLFWLWVYEIELFEKDNSTRSKGLEWSCPRNGLRMSDLQQLANDVQFWTAKLTAVPHRSL